MYEACDANGNYIDIDDAKQEEKYFCPVCGGELQIKKGDIREHHFAHLAGICEDQWNYDMSEWHREWQRMFPKNTREIVIEHNREKHRADILTGNTVIEFQHSPMSPDEFRERNQFYTEAGYNVVWLFDMRELFDDERMYYNQRYEDENSWEWKWAHATFARFYPEKCRNISLFFELDDDYIKHVAWFSPNGGKYFKTDDVEFRYINNDISKTMFHRVRELYDPILTDTEGPFYHRKLLNCPRNKQYTSDCVNDCDYRDINNCYNEICIYRYRLILDNWNEQTDKVLNIQRNDDGEIKEFTILKKNKKHRFGRQQ